MGHFYAGRTRRALAWTAAWFALTPALALSALSGRLVGPAYALICVAGVLIWVCATFDAVTTSSRASVPRASFGRLFLFWVAVEAVMVLSALVTRRFVVEAFQIPSGSMAPTLLVGDHIFVDKMRTARRGDVIVFPFPENAEQDFIKRVVGLPGDHLEFRGGHPVVNGKPLPSCRVGDLTLTDDRGNPGEGDLFVEVLEGRPYLAVYDRSAANVLEVETFDVAPGELFVLGDNRNNSHDSRRWFHGRGGGVPTQSVRGVSRVVWLSMGPSGVNWDRYGMLTDEPQLPPGAASLQPAFERCLEQLIAP